MKTNIKDLTEIPEICPVTGLKYKTNPDWSYYSNNYALNVGLLGDKIILPYEAGNVNLETTKIYCDKVQKLIDDNNLMEKGFIVIEDYTFIRSIDNSGKDYFINFYQTKQPSIKALYFIGVSKLIKLTINIIRHLPIIKSEIKVFPTIEDAKIAAFKKLDIKLNKVNNFNIIKDDFSVSLSIYNKKTVYSKLTGFVTEEYLPEVYQKLETILKLINAKKGHYRIVDYTDFNGGSDKARRKYLQQILKLNKTYPTIAYIIIGVSKTIKTIMLVSKPLVPFDIFFVDSLEQAYEKIKQLDKKSDLNKKIKPKKIRLYLNEILEAFNETSNIDFLETKVNISEDNPYIDIYNSYEIIKRDFNFILNENEKLSKKIDNISKTIIQNSNSDYENLKIILAKLNEIINIISVNTQLIFEQDEVPYSTLKLLNKILQKTTYLSSALNDLSVLNFVPIIKDKTSIKNIFNDIKETFYNINTTYDINFINNKNYDSDIVINDSMVKQIIINILSSIINKKPTNNINISYNIINNNIEFNIKTTDKLFTNEQISNFNKQNNINDINLTIAKNIAKKNNTEIIILPGNDTNFFFTTDI